MQKFARLLLTSCFLIQRLVISKSLLLSFSKYKVLSIGMHSSIASPSLLLSVRSSDENSSSKNKIMDMDADLYNSCMSAAVDISDANLNGNVLTFIRSARDIDINAKRKFLHHIVINKENAQYTITLPVMQMPTDIKMRSVSPSGDKIAIFSTQNNEEIVEVWKDGGTSLRRKIVLPKKMHGAVCTDMSWFGSLSWNPKEDCLVYSAEMVPPKTKSFFAPQDPESLDNSNEAFIGKTNTLGYGKSENWGEKYTSTSRLNLYIVHLETGKVAEVTNVPGVTNTTLNGFVLGQAVFSPCGKQLVYTAWDAGGGGKMAKRLGSIYCYQRHSAIYSSPVSQLLEYLFSSDKHKERDNDFTCITPNARLARSPRFIRVKKDCTDKLIFLCNPSGFDTHGGVMGIHTIGWSTKGAAAGDEKTLVHIVQELEGDSFPGIFTNQLPEGHFSDPEGDFIFVTTQWKSVSKIIRIDTSCGKVSQIVPVCSEGINTTDTSQQFVCMNKSGDLVLCQSAPNKPPELVFIPTESLKIRNIDILPGFILKSLGVISASTAFSPMKFDFNTSSYHVISTVAPHGKVDACIEGILLLPENTKSKAPLIVIPHGGPHACTSTSYSPSSAFLCLSGYAILHVNYRGSSGYGQAALESLAGLIGSQDVMDVVHLVDEVKRKFGHVIDETRLAICGGSHGGFLVGHLTGQYPSLFRCAAMRNPVTNIPGMVSVTDIPDWCYIETFGTKTYDWARFTGPSAEQLSKMWASSPIAYVENVTVPTLVAIGLKDMRVPPSQGYEWYCTLRSRGVTTELLQYEDDDHAIDRVQNEADYWINVKKWFDIHLLES